MEDTAAAVRCELYNKYRLVLTNQHITLVDPVTGNPVLSWLYRYVRRYGVNANSFLLEGGRSAAPGNGLFIFKNCKGHQIREIMESKMKAFARQEDDDEKYSYAVFDRGSTASTASVVGGANNDTSNQRDGETRSSHGSRCNAKVSSTHDATDEDVQYYNAGFAGEITTTHSAAVMPDVCDYPENETLHCVSLPGVHTSKLMSNSAAEKGGAKHQPNVMSKTTGKKPAVSEKPSKVTKDNAKKKSANIENDKARSNCKSTDDTDDIDGLPSRPVPAPSMSEVLRQLASQNLNPTKGGGGGEDNVYGYSQLDIKQEGRRERVVGEDQAEGHLYGDKLVQQIRKEEECPYEELSMGQ